MAKKVIVVRVIGLTGGIATGKSAVSNILRKFDVPVIDSDELAHRVVEKGQPALEEIVREFGAEVFASDGTLDRRKLGELVFRNPKARKKLEEITHPRIMKMVLEQLARYRLEGRKLVVLDAPLLIEAGLQSMVDQVWVVVCDKDLQVQRLMQRSNLTEEEALERINAQMPLEEKVKYADRVIENNGTLSELEQKVISMWQEELMK